MMKSLTALGIALLLLCATLLPATTEARVGGVIPDDEKAPGQSREMRHVRRKLVLSVCEGNCNTSADCEGDLVCYLRTTDAEILGCDTPTSPRHNICIPDWLNPNTPQLPPIVTVGNVRPLEECWGDCDTNADCRQGLICLQRAGGEPIPGCRGSDGSRTNYCVQPIATTITPEEFRAGPTFPNEFRWGYSMTLTFGYPGNAATRTPTAAEYDGARQAIVDWLNDSSRRHYAGAVSYSYERTEVTVESQSLEQWVLTLSAVFRANTRSEVPTQLWYLQAMTGFDGTNLIRNFRDKPPANSVFSTVQSESRLINWITPTLPPGSTFSPAFENALPPCPPMHSACSDSIDRDDNDRRN